MAARQRADTTRVFHNRYCALFVARTRDKNGTKLALRGRPWNRTIDLSVCDAVGHLTRTRIGLRFSSGLAYHENGLSCRWL